MELPQQLQNLLGSVHMRIDENPRRDWLLLMLAFVLALTGSVMWSTFFFLDVITREPGTGQEATTVPDVSALEAAKEAATKREEEATRFQSEYRFVDPSR